jgi:cbb3-type cytochrome oxidase cytochrome c subunit
MEIDNSQVLSELMVEIKRYGSAEAFAKENGFRSSFVSMVLAGKRKVSPRLARAVGYSQRREWVKQQQGD